MFTAILPSSNHPAKRRFQLMLTSQNPKQWKVNFILSLIMLLAIASPALGTQTVNIKVDWEYAAPSGKTVNVYRLYKDNRPVCDTLTPLNTQCVIPASEGPAYFTMTAVFSDGTTSSHSEPYSMFFAEDYQKAAMMFDWLETMFPDVLSPAPQSTTVNNGIYTRLYTDTGISFSIHPDQLYYIDHQGVSHDLDRLDDWLIGFYYNDEQIIFTLYDTLDALFSDVPPSDRSPPQPDAGNKTLPAILMLLLGD